MVVDGTLCHIKDFHPCLEPYLPESARLIQIGSSPESSYDNSSEDMLSADGLALPQDFLISSCQEPATRIYMITKITKPLLLPIEVYQNHLMTTNKQVLPSDPPSPVIMTSKMIRPILSSPRELHIRSKLPPAVHFVIM